MSLRTALIAAVILGLGGLGIVGWIGTQLPPRPAIAMAVTPVAEQKVQILVAAHPLRAGSLLKFDDIQPREVLASDVHAGARIDTPAARAELAGSMIRRGLQPLDVLLPADLLRPGDRGFLAAVLQAGMRATTVGVDAVSGTAGLIWPGDHVDAILTQISDDKALPASHRASAETVMTDARVIAIDQQLMQGATGSGSGTEPGTTHTVTLEVTEAQAERLALAARLGHLSLIVRAAEPAAGNAEPKPATTWGGDVSPALNQGRAAGRVMHVYQGTSTGQELRFQ